MDHDRHTEDVMKIRLPKTWISAEFSQNELIALFFEFKPMKLMVVLISLIHYISKVYYPNMWKQNTIKC